MRVKKIHITLLFVLFATIDCFAQEFPPILNFTQSEYAAGTQNWMISEDKNHFMFFANNEGLLEFNGSEWKLYPSPNETIIRSVKVVGDKIYTGCYMEFGYWKREDNNQLTYFSLSKKINEYILDDEQFWNIIHYEHWIVFQSLNKIYVYNTKTDSFKIIFPKNPIVKSFQTANAIYYQVANEGLFEIENGKSKLVSNESLVLNNRIVAVFNSNDGLLIQTQEYGFLTFINGKIASLVSDENKAIAASSVYSCLQLADGSFAIGTISNGVFILSSTGRIKYHIEQSNGLSNNTILSLFEDSDNNLWVGLDNGVDCINLKSPIKNFADHSGRLGTVYTSLRYQDKLYLGTNQGLFYRNINSEDQFNFIKGTKGQVWSLFEYQGTLFCGHDLGTFVVDKTNIELVYSSSGTWKFSSVPGRDDLLLQGNYFGLSILQKVGSKWIFRNKIEGFSYSSKHFEFLTKNELYVSHEYKGVFQLVLEKDLLKVKNFRSLKIPSKGKHASLSKFNDVIYCANKFGIFKLNTKTKLFEKDKNLSEVFQNDEYISGKLIADKHNKLWLFTKNYIYYFTMNKLSTELKKNSIPIPSSLTNSMLGYENISQLSNSSYLVGTADGYYTINLNKLDFKSRPVTISRILINKLDEKQFLSSTKVEGLFDYDQNNVTMHFTVPDYKKYIYTEYQYVLEGLEEEWSEWSAKTMVNFKNLPPGSYTFKVRSKFIDSLANDYSTYKFYISKPWYATNLAILIYLILASMAAYYVNKAYTKHYQVQNQKLIEENNLLLEIKELENEQQIMKLKNEQLSQDVNLKSKELAMTNMSLIKKDELLTLIKEDLKKSSSDASSRNIKTVINTINKNISGDNAWEVFREAFDTADKDFLKKVKSAHASLTPNDLRLCAYLRLNLSSKEIAPLLNISVRSVEIKRYRLRKKMELAHESGLVEYILSI